MAKIIIKNFRAIDYAEIEIKPFTVIIGEQASGKSTISKLVYFFQRLLFDSPIVQRKYFIINDRNKAKNIDFEIEKQNIELELIKHLKIKFFEFFDSVKDEIFTINFEGYNYSINLKGNTKVSIDIEFIKSPLDIFWLELSYSGFKELAKSYRISKNDRLLMLDKLSDDFHRIGKSGQLGLFFIPASRSLITTILPASQSKFIAEIDQRADDKQIDFFVKTFLDDIDYFKRNYFFGKSLDDVIDEFELKTGKENPKAKLLRDKISTILKADYQHGNSGEVLVNKRFLKPVSLDKASSGQQEVVWILLTLLSLVLEDNKSFVVIEEPEAHLYPKTQAQVVEYIAQFFNAKEGNEVILTTHSPYILTVLNNLLFAKQISIKTHGVENQTIAESIDQNAWLDIDKFSAYYVGRNDDGQFIKSIINPETGLISVNALDDASDDIMDTFDNLMDIYKGAAV